MKRRYKGDAKAKADSRKKQTKTRYGKDDWRELIAGKPFKLKGDEPDFSEEAMGKKETEERLSRQNTEKILSVARIDLRTDEIEKNCHSYPD